MEPHSSRIESRANLLLAAFVGLVILVALRPDRLVQAGEVDLSVTSFARFDAFRTFSGLLTLLAMLALLSRRFTPAGLLLTIDGAAGTGIFWDRWSREAGHHVELTTLFSGVPPSAGQLELLATHLPLLVMGVVILAVVGWRNGGGHGFRPES